MQEAHLFQVSRDRLLADDSRPVVVIEGPSGYGKTLLAQAWLKRADAPQRGIWITLDAELRDPSVFLERLADELIGKQPQVEGGGLDESSLLSNRFSRITDQLSDSEHPIRLVFDDVHLVAGSEAANYIRRLLMAAGGPLKILITTQPVASRPMAAAYSCLANASETGAYSWRESHSSPPLRPSARLAGPSNNSWLLGSC